MAVKVELLFMLNRCQFKQRIRFLPVALLLFAMQIGHGAAMAETHWDPYIPPELAFSDDLRQKITLPTKLNINQSSLTQLKILPGFDEEIALKVMRGRPFVDIQDFYSKLPGLNKKQIDHLIEQVQPRILFK